MHGASLTVASVIGHGSTFQVDIPVHTGQHEGGVQCKRILVVEDTEDNRQILRDLFGSAGYEIIEAPMAPRASPTHGAAAEPDPDGHSASRARRLRGDPAHQGKSDHRGYPGGRGDLLRAQRRRGEGTGRGCDGYIAKPFSPRQCSRRCARCCADGRRKSLPMRNRPLILVVDDAPDNVEILRHRLESLAYDVIVAADGEAALELVRAHWPDLVLLDVMMPKLDGIETVRRLKADPGLPFTPGDFADGAIGIEEIVTGLDGGADEYLTKPFDHGALLARVRAMLRTKALHDQVQGLAAELANLNLRLEQRVADQLGELKRLGWLRRFLAPQVADLVLSADADVLRSHRAHVAVAFCDLRGFTAFSELAEPEEQIAMLSEYHTSLAALINEYGGTLIHIIGDGMMVFFNDPMPCPEPSVQAVRMAVEMRDHVGGAAVKWDARGFRLGFGIGIAEGYATLGQIGFEDRAEYTAIGTVTILPRGFARRPRTGRF